MDRSRRTDAQAVAPITPASAGQRGINQSAARRRQLGEERVPVERSERIEPCLESPWRRGKAGGFGTASYEHVAGTVDCDGVDGVVTAASQKRAPEKRADGTELGN